MTPADFKSFVDGYIECALWSSNDRTDDGGDDPLDRNYSAEDLSFETATAMVADCKAFVDANAADLAVAIEAYGKDDSPGYAGHDFWLTRNGHGAGFWDGDLPDALGKRLADAAYAFGTCDLYVEDGKIVAD
jgi:hypothetical protein